LALRSGIIGGLFLVLAASAAHPLAHGLSVRQSVVVLLIVVPAAFVPGLAAHDRSNRLRLIGFALALGALLFLFWILGPPGGKLPVFPKSRNPTLKGGGTRGAAGHSFDLLGLLMEIGIVLLVLALLAGAGVVLALVLRKRKPALPLTSIAPEPAPKPESIARRVYSLLGDTLEDLRREPDSRKAVIAAYARMELGLGALGIDQRRSETPFEYLARVLQAVSVSGPAARRLTDLFERAKFSPAAVAPDMKGAAIDALSAIREEVVASVV
jgi:hypothetical protein